MYFISKLSPEDRVRFEELSHLHMELSATEEDDLFAYSFTLGMLLMMDVGKEAENLWNDAMI